jgi:prefoldin subunit 5
MDTTSDDRVEIHALRERVKELDEVIRHLERRITELTARLATYQGDAGDITNQDRNT